MIVRYIYVHLIVVVVVIIIIIIISAFRVTQGHRRPRGSIEIINIIC